MTQQMNSQVPLVLSNVTKCKCPECPVQTKSQCVAKLIEGLGEAVKRDPLRSAEIPGAYCGTGEAICTDLNLDQNCLCGECPVFAEYQLAAGAPVGYYCRDGASR